MALTPDAVPVLLDLWAEELERLTAALRDPDELLGVVRRGVITIKVGITYDIERDTLGSDVVVSAKLPARQRAGGTLHWDEDKIVAGDEDTGQLSLLGGGES